MGLRMTVPKEEVVAFCKRWNIVELAFFGSVLRDDFGPDSDINALGNLRHGVGYRGITETLDIEEELVDILGRKVDLAFRSNVESSRNYIRRDAVLKSAKVFYATE